MKRVLFFNENPIPKVYAKGTIAAKELRLRAALTEIDEVHVIAPPGRSIETADKSVGDLEKKVKVHLTIPWPYYFRGIPHFFYGIYYILKLRPVLLEAESGIISGPAVVLLGKIFGLPTVVELRASYEELIKVHAKIVPYWLKKILLQWVTWFSYALATGLIANSKTYQQYLGKRGFESVEINPGLQYAPEKINPKRQKVIGYLGRLVEEKGIDDLLQAVASIKQQIVKYGWKVWIVGEGVRRNQLEKLAERLKIDKVVEFLGSQKNYEILSKISLLVNPCYVKAPLEMVNAEAAWMGVPVVCYGDKQIPETVVDQKTGIKLRYREVKQLSDTLRKLIIDETRRNELGGNGHLFAEKNYGFELQVARLRRLYQEMGII